MEDDPASGQALRRLLGFKGYDVTLVTTLAEAHAYVANYDADYDADQAAGGPSSSVTGAARLIVLLDLMLPDGDGAALLRQLRGRPGVFWVAVLSAVSDPHRLRDVLSLDPDLFLSKPLNLAELMQGLGGA